MVDIDRIDIWSTFGRLLVGSTLVDFSRNDRPDQKWVVGSTLVDCKSTRPPALVFGPIFHVGVSGKDTVVVVCVCVRGSRRTAACTLGVVAGTPLAV